MHGYQIIQELTERTGGVLAPEPRLRLPDAAAARGRGELVRETAAEGKRVYELTETGRELAAGTTAPWTAVAGESEDALVALRDLAHQVLAATRQVAHAGTAAQLESAQAILRDAGRASTGSSRTRRTDSTGPPGGAGGPSTSQPASSAAASATSAAASTCAAAAEVRSARRARRRARLPGAPHDDITGDDGGGHAGPARLRERVADDLADERRGVEAALARQHERRASSAARAPRGRRRGGAPGRAGARSSEAAEEATRRPCAGKVLHVDAEERAVAVGDRIEARSSTSRRAEAPFVGRRRGRPSTNVVATSQATTRPRHRGRSRVPRALRGLRPRRRAADRHDDPLRALAQRDRMSSPVPVVVARRGSFSAPTRERPLRVPSRPPPCPPASPTPPRPARRAGP